MNSTDRPEEQATRHGDPTDPDQDRSAHADDAERKAPPEDDPDSPGATIDDPEPAEPNEPG